MHIVNMATMERLKINLFETSPLLQLIVGDAGRLSFESHTKWHTASLRDQAASCN